MPKDVKVYDAPKEMAKIAKQAAQGAQEAVDNAGTYNKPVMTHAQWLAAAAGGDPGAPALARKIAAERGSPLSVNVSPPPIPTIREKS